MNKKRNFFILQSLQILNYLPTVRNKNIFVNFMYPLPNENIMKRLTIICINVSDQKKGSEDKVNLF